MLNQYSPPNLETTHHELKKSSQCIGYKAKIIDAITADKII